MSFLKTNAKQRGKSEEQNPSTGLGGSPSLFPNINEVTYNG